MPSVADLQQTTKLSSNTNNGKSTPTLQQQSNSTSSGNQIDTTNVDPITQAILLLEKKQRNLGKRKVFTFDFIFNKKQGNNVAFLFLRKNLKVMNKKRNRVKNLIKIKRFVGKISLF